MTTTSNSQTLTNEERRVTFYSESDTPTIPSTVSPATPLDELNLNWRERDLPEKERTKHVHRLHPYLGKFIPQLVEIFLRKFFSRGQTVLDPFCGSGTTLVQANELGINSVGFDISAFNVLLCRAKTAKYDVPKLREEVLEALHALKAAIAPKGQTLALFEPRAVYANISSSDSEYLQNWYAPQALRELLTYMISDPKTITRAVHLMIVCRCLERIADHATNIAEDVIFMVDALVIKHHADAKEKEA